MSANHVFTCIERVIPAEHEEEARTLATEENFANGLEAFGDPKKFWKPGRTLKVRFLDGVPEVQEKVRHYALQWTDYANIKFEFGEEEWSQIRISFRQSGSWSAVGTDAGVLWSFPKNEPTMNFGWLTKDTGEDEVAQVVLHEFGHALGLYHEHQHPTMEIPWDKEAVYASLMGPPNKWDKRTIDKNMFEKYSAEVTQYTEFDPKSIMLYSFPPEWTQDRRSMPPNRELSEMDKAFIRSCYPATS